MTAKRVAVFVAAAEADALHLPAASPGVSFEAVLISPGSSRSIRSQVRAAIASGAFNAAMSAFVGDDESGRDVLETIEVLNLPIVGCKARCVQWSRRELKMEAFYWDAKTNIFHLVLKEDFEENQEAAIAGIKYPVFVRQLIDTGIPTSDKSTLSSAEELTRYLQDSYFRTIDTIALVEEVPEYGVRISLVAGEGGAVCNGSSDGVAVLPIVAEIFGERPNATLIAGSDSEVIAQTVEAHSKSIDKVCRKVFKNAFEDAGYVGFEFIVSAKDATSTTFDSLALVSLVPNCNILLQVDKSVDGGTGESVKRLEQHCGVDSWFSAIVASSLKRHRIPTFEVRFDPHVKGYFLQAHRPIAKGEVVFKNEGRAHPIVTRGYVDRTWSEEDKKTFSQYAWPLDDVGFVYAFFENEPRNWRPVNHSCDPTMHHADGHSLDEIARRDIAKGEELTLDYVTYNDSSMQPFDCLCGAATCRGRIAPDPEILKSYGTNAWCRVYR